jgi:hypothetical protein
MQRFAFARRGILRAPSISGEGSALLKCSRYSRQKSVLPLVSLIRLSTMRENLGVAGRCPWDLNARSSRSEGRHAPFNRSEPAQSLEPLHSELALSKDGCDLHAEVGRWKLRCMWESM